MKYNEENDATVSSAYQDKLFGSVDDYHIIEYKKSPFIIYNNFFHPVICEKILSQAEEIKYSPFNDGKSRFHTISYNKFLTKINYRWLLKPLNELLNDANNKNFMIDVSQIQYLTLMKFYEGDFWDWHHDCDWWFNPLPYDKKITILIQLNDSTEFDGGEFEQFMSTIPIPEKYLSIGSVVVFPTYFYYKLKPITRGIRKLLNVTAIGPKYK